MNPRVRLPFLAVGLLLGGLAAGFWAARDQPALAATDHFDDVILCTGTVTAEMKDSAVFDAAAQTYRHHREPIPYDGIWLLDCRSGKLLATVIDRSVGKIKGWAQADLGREFGIAPHQASHFMMATGAVSQQQAALYVAETTSGQLGVYTLAPSVQDPSGVEIRRHDRSPFRQPREN
jgi:hypothetical protein